MRAEYWWVALTLLSFATIAYSEISFEPRMIKESTEFCESYGLVHSEEERGICGSCNGNFIHCRCEYFLEFFGMPSCRFEEAWILPQGGTPYVYWEDLNDFRQTIIQ